MSLLGGALSARSSCTVTVAVSSALAATYDNVIAPGAVQVTGAPPNAATVLHRMRARRCDMLV